MKINGDCKNLFYPKALMAKPNLMEGYDGLALIVLNIFLENGYKPVNNETNRQSTIK
jgi:hypothetical protein